MTKHGFAPSRKISLLCGLLLFLDAPRVLKGQPPPDAVAAFDSYSKAVERRIEQQHQSASAFLAPADIAWERLRKGELSFEQLAPSSTANLPEALLHHWRGTAFAPGATASDFEGLMRNFSSYPQHFSPEVLQARVVREDGNRMQAWIRVRQKHVITVVMDTSYDVTFGQLDVKHGYSISRSTRIDEIDSVETKYERVLSPTEEHGFLWRLNTYWSYEERDGGLYLQIEALSLTRSIPKGLGWMIGPYVESIPRESLEFTLRSACNAVQKQPR